MIPYVFSYGLVCMVVRPVNLYEYLVLAATTLLCITYLRGQEAQIPS